ncbi:hypothetical protein BU17DRAFT_68219 [Hysterangium stoloniferum]|nr:hypothetical protein BU17DRAFT_68219 [Hysterangium stoloniferum]
MDYSSNALSNLPRASCEPAEPANTVTDRLNGLLSSGGAGYVLSLCPNQNYTITAPLQFTAPNQEISTQGLPSDDSRAMLSISGPVLQPGQANHTTAVSGQCKTCDGIKLRHVQIYGSRNGARSVRGGANIEMGGSNTGQLIEFVRSFDPRSWSCLHVSEGALDCSGAIVQNNDIGPCGSDASGQWADGISIACAGTTVRNNLINTPTDGGIVLFGAPGSVVENNTIWVETNLVDYNPWKGDYDGTVVRNNSIVGGFATDSPTDAGDNRGSNNESAIIKMGIAMGPHIWFGNSFKANVSRGAIVMDNRFEGAFGYAMAVSSVANFTVLNNILVGNTTFVGSIGPNCSNAQGRTPLGQPFVVQQSLVTASNLQTDFTNIQDANTLTCIIPPTGGDYWPFGKSHDPDAPPFVPDGPTSSSSGGNAGAKAGIAIGVIAGIALVAFTVWYVPRCVAARRVRRSHESWATMQRRMSQH